MKVADAFVDIKADISSLKKDLKKAEDLAKKSSKNMEKNIGGLSKVAKKVGIALVAAFSARALFNGMKNFIRLANEQEKAEAKLAAVIKSTGQAAGFSAKELIAYAGELQKVTTYGDEVTISAMSLLATFKELSGDVYKRAIKVSMDLATVNQVDLKTSVLQLAKALNDPITQMGAMSRSGITFTKTQKDMVKQLWESNRRLEAQRMILKEVESQYGGTAQAVAETFGGKLQQVANAWGDINEKMGQVLTKSPEAIAALDAVKNMVVSLGDAVTYAAEKWSPFIRNLATAAKEIFDALSGKLSMSEIFFGIDKNTLSDWQRTVALAKSMPEIARETADSNEVNDTLLKKKEESYKTITQLAKEHADVVVTQKLNQAELVRNVRDQVDALAEVTKELEIQRRVDIADSDMFQGQGAAKERARKMTEPVEDAKAAMLDFGDVVTTIGDGISEAFTGMILGTKSVGDAFKEMAASIVADMVKIAVNQLIVRNLMSAFGFTTHAQGGVFNNGNMMAFANGGVISGPTIFPMKNGMGLMGEAGPEAVMPLSRTASGELGVKTTGQDKPNLTVNIINKTGTEAQASQAPPKWDGEGWVVDVMIDAYSRNKSGIRDIFGS